MYPVELCAAPKYINIGPRKNKWVPIEFDITRMSVMSVHGEMPIKWKRATNPKTQTFCFEVEKDVFITVNMYSIECISLDNITSVRHIL